MVDNRIGVMLQLDCEPIMRTIQSLAQQIEEIDYRIDTLQAEAMQFNPLQYIISQRAVNRLIGVKQAYRDEWNNAMNEFAICRSVYPAHYHFDQEHALPGR